MPVLYCFNEENNPFKSVINYFTEINIATLKC